MTTEEPKRPSKSLSRIRDLKFDPAKASVVGVDRNGGAQFYRIHQEHFNSYTRETSVYRDTSGRSYFEVTKFGADQMLLARILKGIIPVSDVVYDNGRFLSYDMPLASISKDTERTRQRSRMSAYNLLLYFVFGDDDHYIPSHNVKALGNGIKLFDFVGFGEYFWESRKIRDSRENPAGINNPENKQAKTILQVLLLRLRERLVGEEGLSYIRAILDNIKKASSEIPVTIRKAPGLDIATKTKSFRVAVLKRVIDLEKLISEHDKY